MVAFLLGAVAGFALSSIIGDVQARKEHESPYGNISDYLKKRLHLDQEQIRLYDEVLETRRARMAEIHGEYRNSFRRQIDTLRQEIRAILRDDQLVEYEKFIEEYERYREAKRVHEDKD